MKRRKLLLLMMSLVLSTNFIEGCSKSQNVNVLDTEAQEIANVSEDEKSTEEQETTEEADNVDSPKEQGTTETSEDVNPSEDTDTPVSESDENGSQFSFADISNLQFWYGSGVGAWCTVLYIHEDGTFEGEYHDSDMGDIGDGYPNGVYYLCDFTGKFTEPEKVDDYTYSVKIESIELEEEPETEEIKNEMKYIYSEPYGLDNAEDILIYLPGASLEELPEEYRMWAGYSDLIGSEETQLPFYGLYNVKSGAGFSSYEEVETSAIDDELAIVEENASILENKLQTEDLTQLEMTEISSQIYQLWDDELNTIWKQLKETLDSTTMDALTVEEREWITQKEDEINEAGAGYEGGSIQPMVENQKGAELTRERVYELAEYLR